jgi:hypothetical protein
MRQMRSRLCKKYVMDTVCTEQLMCVFMFGRGMLRIHACPDTDEAQLLH